MLTSIFPSLTLTYLSRFPIRPVRTCHYPNKGLVTTTTTPTAEEGGGGSSSSHDDEIDDTELTKSPALRRAKKAASQEKKKKNQAYMYKAITRSLFLTRIETVFDVRNKGELTKYTGYTKPLCNILVRDSTPLYVHTEYVYDNELQNKLPL